MRKLAIGTRVVWTLQYAVQGFGRGNSGRGTITGRQLVDGHMMYVVSRRLLVRRSEIRPVKRVYRCNQCDPHCDQETRVKCFGCGLPVCEPCSLRIKWYYHGRQRVCYNCIEDHLKEGQRGEYLVLRHDWRKAGYKTKDFKAYWERGEYPRSR